MKFKNHNFIKNKYSDHLFHCKECNLSLNCKRKIYYIRPNIKSSMNVIDYNNLIDKNKSYFIDFSDLLSCEETIIKKMLE